jgi:hypothetical protein
MSGLVGQSRQLFAAAVLLPVRHRVSHFACTLPPRRHRSEYSPATGTCVYSTLTVRRTRKVRLGSNLPG